MFIKESRSAHSNIVRYVRATQVAVLSLLLLSFCAITFFNPYLYNYPIYKGGHYFFAELLSLTVCAGVFIEISTVRKFYSLTKLDIAFAAFVSACLLSRIRFANDLYINEITMNFFMLCPIYLLIRLVINNQNIGILFYVLAALYVIEITMLVTELATSYHSTHLFLALKGTLGNSGLCAEFLLLVTPVIGRLLGKHRFKARLIVYALTSIAIFLMESRAALLALAVILAFDWGLFESGRTRQRFAKSQFALLVVIATIFAGLLICKKNSALGRVFIWELSAKHAFGSPIVGIGYGEFPKHYQDWQLSYFLSPDANQKNIAFADLPNNCFNEVLQIFIELGAAGLFCFLLICYLVCQARPKSNQSPVRTLKVSLCALLVFSLFSYPLHSLPILSFGIIFLAAISTFGLSSQKVLIKGVYGRLLLAIVFFWSAYAVAFSKQNNEAIATWNSAKKTESAHQSGALNLYGKAYPQLKTNGLFLLDYGMSLFYNHKYRECIGVLHKSSLLLPSTEPILFAARSYQELGDLNDAESLYYQALNSIPSRLAPKYLLLKLYLLKRDTANARNLCINMIGSGEKAPSVEGEAYLQFAEETLKKIK
ncbi:O-antigen ligase family protein [Mucilaginibacter sp. dw_454]|uniref:O-antigen ligase family protein n=1 Tax=Mucilaginibacter sp. dw_454 TaxID=2720079 RepID=UPI001BD4D2FA|nr:O-antigen ligase family protein [Mucilaginibacter sp. dw_454]